MRQQPHLFLSLGRCQTQNRRHARQRFFINFLSRSVFSLALMACVISTPIVAQTSEAPELFTYVELATLYDEEDIPQSLVSKLNRLLTTPFVDNSHAQTELVRLARTPQLGEFLRVAFWNIERGLEYEAIEAAFSDEARFAALLDAERYPMGSAARGGGGGCEFARGGRDRAERS